ncbi:PSP1 C-terminal conserved region containing protein [Leishmania donovani]|nr:PSP1 C-terminal conserved region containing protein [Leishmania donovani]
MPKSANTRGGAGSGSTYNTQRHEGGRPSARRATAPRAEATPKGTAAVEEKGKPTTVHQKVHISDPRSSAQRQRSEEDAQVQREPSSLSSMHALNASSPAFIPYQYVQQQQCGNAGDDVADAATQSVFSFTATPSLMYMGNTGGSSSVSSPLAFAVPSDAGHSTAMLSPFSPSLAAKQDSLANSATFASVASAAASGSALSTQPSHQLRGAYARATAAAAAAAASSALHLHHTDPYASVAAAPNSAVPAGTADAPPHTQLEPQQRCATRKTPVAASSTAKAVYGPSVPVFHSQFIDIATGNTSMTPFALLQEQPDGDDVDRLSEACDDRHTGAETAPEPATIGAMAAVPRSPPTLAQDREEAETQRVRQAYNSASQQPSQRRISAATAAVLASQDARLAERSRRYAQAGQLLYEPASATTTAALSSNGASSQRPSNKDASDAATAKPIVKAQRHTSAFETATASETETTTHETPKRRSPTVSTATVGTSNGNKVRTSVTPSIDGGASAVKRLHTCLASTDERTEGDRAGSAMGLTGSTRRGLPTCGDDNDDEGRRSDTVTPTTTPAKVLAAESSPFVAAAAASGGASTGRAHRRSVSREDSAVAHSECGLSESTRHTRVVHQEHSSSSSNAHLQRAMMQLIAQIQTSNTTKGHAFSPAAATTAITPHKSSIQNAALGETGATAATPAAFKTPEVERVPSARPSASKNAAIRNITTIIHTPNTSSAHHGHSSAVTKTTITSETSRHHHSAAETSASAKDSRGAAPKVAQRSLASCLEAISPQRGESARNSSNAVRAELATAMSQAPLPSSSSAPFMPSGTAGAMPVPRSQRRGTKQGSSSATSAAAAGAAESRSPAAQATNYAVVIEGHMQRRVTAVSSTVLKRGVCVLFEEDRGIDMGRVVQCDVLDGDGAASMLATMASATSPLSRKDRPAPVLRPATAEEEYRWLYADVKEAEATLEPCREAAARLGLPVKVVAAVYQFNKAKLTFYYESPTRVDFRPLLPSLFSRFHCRIWMARLETPEMTAAASGGVEEGAHTHLQAEKSA